MHPIESSRTDRLVATLKGAMVALLRRDARDLTSRQLGVFMSVCLDEGPHTVRGLSALLKVSKPAIVRAVDRLVELGLARRIPDPADLRSVLVERTHQGEDFLTELGQAMAEAEQHACGVPTRRAPTANEDSPAATA